MGFLTEGTPLGWEAAAQFRAKVRRDGVEQFLAAYKSGLGRVDQVLRWGDEVEYMVLRRVPAPLAQQDVVAANGPARDEPGAVNGLPPMQRAGDGAQAPREFVLSLRAPELIEILQRDEHSHPEGGTVDVLWRPEYANWMIEGTPGVPYRTTAEDLCVVERNMALRRLEVQNILQPDEIVISLPAFPRLGCGQFTSPPTYPLGPVAQSLFVSDDVINPHPRFATLTRNIRLRRGSKVDIRVPLFQDERTPAAIPVITEPIPQWPGPERSSTASNDEREQLQNLRERAQHAETDDLYLDCMAFGMGACCLQVTLQTRDVKESRMLYDQLAVLAPIFMALSAATPIQRGMLLDTDVRWNVIAASVDDRTPEERDGLIAKSRYDSISCFIGNYEESDGIDTRAYNDLELEINDEAYKKLRSEGVDELLARHVAHLFIRDPLVIFDNRIDVNNAADMDHFENIQSTNWNTVRFKPPAVGSDIGWRVEFRSMDIQLTDFENAALAVFTVLTSRVILAYRLNLYVPMSKVDANMAIAHERDALRNQRFFFRRNIFHHASVQPPQSFLCSCGSEHGPVFDWGREFSCPDCDPSDPEFCGLLSMDEIVNGKLVENGFSFPGLIPLIKGYLEALEVKPETRAKIYEYLDFISARASGRLLTLASYIREVVTNHPAYKQDSVVSQEICTDLLEHLIAIERGACAAPRFLGSFGRVERDQSARPNDELKAEAREERSTDDDGVVLPGQSLSRSTLERSFQLFAKNVPHL
ncbi:Glutamate--cysteine ligase catalytic subunit [Porphyridium purpureum]|uniref:Glutamate--cysteine ligase n=1 Tax=Porphyridium purpureum TaxID=35688 RepID=A0A5J4Z4S0_PORPP|nr:Glutamate--cysteine ligase catalytic subunit [Porphyridium purpureum]|eukprot:POR5104..scf295_1